MGRQNGVAADQIAALPDYASSPVFSEVEKIALEYTDAMTYVPVEVSDDLFERLGHHLSEKQLVELTAAIAWENYRARFDHAFGIESEDFSKGQACAIPVRAVEGSELVADKKAS